VLRAYNLGRLQPLAKGIIRNIILRIELDLLGYPLLWLEIGGIEPGRAQRLHFRAAEPAEPAFLARTGDGIVRPGSTRFRPSQPVQKALQPRRLHPCCCAAGPWIAPTLVVQTRGRSFLESGHKHQLPSRRSGVESRPSFMPDRFPTGAV
jgi:hypothetical protein